MSGRFFDMEENMAEQTPQPEEIMAVNGSVSGEMPQNDGVVKEVGEKSENTGRNSDGTFAEGNEIWKSRDPEISHRPIQELSYRVMSKVRHAKNPQRVQDDLNRLDEIIDDENSSPADVMRALDMKIRLNNGYDPVENKVSGEVMQITENPLNQLSIEELRTLKALKKESSDGK